MKTGLKPCPEMAPTPTCPAGANACPGDIAVRITGGKSSERDLAATLVAFETTGRHLRDALAAKEG